MGRNYQPSCMNEAPDGRARRAQPENDRSAGLNAKAPPKAARAFDTWMVVKK